VPPYQSLYRKHRPGRFAEVVGQDHVTTALRNAVRDDRTGHAYLFSGPRGTGKTTTARILAKALNCLALGDDGEPCDGCENCLAIRGGRFLDLFELDAASNNSVDNIRDLTESVHLGMGPTARRKVYLVDEVHMLSAAASNALLKTLEEPPDHVVFVLATTNPEKVLPTIRSRSQHFELNLLTLAELAVHLADICEREGVDADADALDVVARAAAGSARDALSLLDQALAHGPGKLDVASVDDLFGRTPFELRARVLEAIAAGDPPGALVAVTELHEAGHEPRRVAEDLLRAARDAFLLISGAGQVQTGLPDDEARCLDELGRALSDVSLLATIETLGQAIVDMRGTDAADPRLVVEVAVVRLARRDAVPPLRALAERVERLERAIGSGTGPTRPDASAPGPDVASSPSRSPRSPGRTLGAVARERERDARDARAEPDAVEPKPEPGPERESEAGLAPAAPVSEAPVPAAPVSEVRRRVAVDLDDVIVAWAQILPDLPVATRSAAQEAQPVSLEGDVITFAVPGRLVEAARPRFRRAADMIRTALADRLGANFRFNVVADDSLTGQDAPLLAPGPSTARSRPTRPQPDPPGAVDPSPASEAPAAPDFDPDDFDPDDLVDAGPAATSSDTVSLLTERLSARVVEERPRELRAPGFDS